MTQAAERNTKFAVYAGSILTTISGMYARDHSIGDMSRSLEQLLINKDSLAIDKIFSEITSHSHWPSENLKALTNLTPALQFLKDDIVHIGSVPIITGAVLLAGKIAGPIISQFASEPAYKITKAVLGEKKANQLSNWIKQNPSDAIALTALIGMCMAEPYQYITHRGTASLDDVALNVAGYLLITKLPDMVGALNAYRKGEITNDDIRQKFSDLRHSITSKLSSPTAIATAALEMEKAQIEDGIHRNAP